MHLTLSPAVNAGGLFWMDIAARLAGVPNHDRASPSLAAPPRPSKWLACICHPTTGYCAGSVPYVLGSAPVNPADPVFHTRAELEAWAAKEARKPKTAMGMLKALDLIRRVTLAHVDLPDSDGGGA